MADRQVTTDDCRRLYLPHILPKTDGLWRRGPRFQPVKLPTLPKLRYLLLEPLEKDTWKRSLEYWQKPSDAATELSQQGASNVTAIAASRDAVHHLSAQ